MKSKFSWVHFPINFLQEVLFSPKTSKSIRPPKMYDEIERLTPYMEDVASIPDTVFVEKYREEIENYYLANSMHLVNVCSHLEGLNSANIGVYYKTDENGKQTSLYDYDKMLSEIRKKRFTERILSAYKNEMLMTGRQIEEPESYFRKPVEIDFVESQLADVPLYDFQKDAVRELNNYFNHEDGKCGVLVMPTGGGKTRTSIYFLLKYLVSKGYQVLWLAHRAMLLEQTSETFYKLSPLVNSEKEVMQQFKMVCISGEHCGAYGMHKTENVMVGSVPSLCHKTEYFKHVLKDKVIVVVDEAHHTYAPSYRRIIDTVRKLRPDSKLLGLTATPVRIQEKATKALMKIFDDKIIYNIPMSDLIANKILADPIYIPIETNVDIEAIINIDERAYIRKWGEMPQSLIEKVARTNKRNEAIVNEYLDNKEKYGKTIIFALNAIHCIALYEAFREKDPNLRVGYVYSLRKDNNEIIERFRDSKKRKDGIDVLININILSEGSDIPDIQTVFLTRPTNSDVLLMQMVGRGMRGPNCDGTETVNIVDFNDKWSDITKWMNPQFLFGDEEPEEPEIVETKGKVSIIPYDMIRDIIKGITYKGVEVVRKGMVLPIGWYDVYDEEGCDRKVIVFDSQVPGYERLENACKNGTINYSDDGSILQDKYFADFGVMPAPNELEYVTKYYEEEEEFPVLQLFEWRDAIDPSKFAQEIIETSMSFNDFDRRVTEIYSIHKDMIDKLYGGLQEYKEKIAICTTFPKGIKPLGTRIEEVEKSSYHLSPKPFPKTLDTLLTEVMKEQRENLLPDFKRPSILWTAKPLASYFGQYTPSENKICINAVLDSETIPADVIKFIIYHECLHQEFTQGHGPAFTYKEHLYPNFNEYDRYLNLNFPDFNTTVSM